MSVKPESYFRQFTAQLSQPESRKMVEEELGRRLFTITSNQLSPILSFVKSESHLSVFRGSAGPQPLKDISEFSHGQVFCKTFCSVNVVKGV